MKLNIKEELLKTFILSMLICIFILFGCTVTHYNYEFIEEEVSLQQWSESSNAKKGYIFVSGMMNTVMAANITQKMIELDTKESIERIRLIMNTNGGQISAFRSIVNSITMLQKPVDVINFGSCYSACVGVYAIASGRRYAFSKTDFMVHRPSNDSRADGIEDAINYETEIYESLLKSKANLPEKWFPLSKKQFYFSAEEAVGYSLVDEIITKLP